MVGATVAVKPIERVLDALKEYRECRRGYTARCPAHNDSEPSLTIWEDEADGHVGLKCFAGCSRVAIAEALGLTEQELYVSDGKYKPKRTPRKIDLMDLAIDKCIHPLLLAHYGLADGYTGITSKGREVKNVIRTPYHLEDGQEYTRFRIRANLTAKKGSWWNTDSQDPLIPYGLNRLEDARKAGYLIIPEGESDCWTLWRFGFPALGIPSASMYNTIHADMLKSIERVFVLAELTDNAGRAFPGNVTKRLQETGYTGTCYAVPLLTTHEAKDPNALLQKLFLEGRINDFKDEMQKALDAAMLIGSESQKAEQPQSSDDLRPLVADAIEKQDVAALYDLAERLALLDTKEQAVLCGLIQTSMQKDKAFSWSSFKKLLAEAKSAQCKREQEERAYVTGRPQILLGRQEREELDDALSALYKANTTPVMFVQGGKLVRIRRDEKGTPMIEAMTDNMIIDRLIRVADFVSYNEMDDSYSSVHPKQRLAQLICSQTSWQFPPIEAIVEAPVLRPDGSILDTAGYDPQTRLYYMPNDEMKQCKVPSHPTRRQVRQAADTILHLIEEFPYETASDRANMVAALLTAVIRFAISGDVQALLIDATKPGTGKGFLAHLMAILATGKMAAPMGLPDKEEEVEKRLGATLMQGSTFIAIDNVNRKLVSATLEILLTAGGSHDTRILGLSKMVRVNTRATWVITGNNLQLGGDLARRCYRVRLVSPVSNPDERTDFRIKDFTGYVQEHRAELVAALLTLARAWFVAGKPKAGNVPHLASFTEWAKTVGGILALAGIEGFQQNRATLKAEANAEEGEWENFLTAWLDCFGEEWIPASKLVSEINKTLPANADQLPANEDQLPANGLFESLPDSLKIALQEKPKSFTMKLAKALEKRIKTPYGKDNIRIERSEDKHTKAKVWRVVRVVAGSLFYATRWQNEFFSASDGREKEEENKNDGEKKNMFEIEEERTDYPQLPANNDPQLPANEEAPKQIGSTGQSTHAGSPNDFAGSPNEQRTIFDDTEGLPEEEYDEVLI